MFRTPHMKTCVNQLRFQRLQLMLRDACVQHEHVCSHSSHVLREKHTRCSVSRGFSDVLDSSEHVCPRATRRIFISTHFLLPHMDFSRINWVHTPQTLVLCSHASLNGSPSQCSTNRSKCLLTYSKLEKCQHSPESHIKRQACSTHSTGSSRWVADIGSGLWTRRCNPTGRPAVRTGQTRRLHRDGQQRGVMGRCLSVGNEARGVTGRCRSAGNEARGVTGRCLSVGNEARSVTGRCLSVGNEARSVTGRCLSVGNEARSVTGRCLSAGNEARCRRSLQASAALYEREGKSWAAVLVCLCAVSGDPALLFTLRSAQLKGRHKGDVSFAGGKKDPLDRSVVETALREAGEELGIHVTEDKVWGVMKPLRDMSGMMIAPVIANLGPLETLSFRPNPSEVEEIFTLTLQHLCQAQNRGYTHFRTGDRYGYTLPVFHSPKYRIWGLTAVALDHALKLIVPPEHPLDHSTFTTEAAC
ncbi:mitochondrial coenzyme A diphosphatase NUDT8 [Siphateles boraxobius]|uniref:mitochondrial coenzyme A diphosphatase NUDT8 n=1 Tax=Siphateles boraxobius TaxID=180520 RepID=UPI004064108A